MDNRSNISKEKYLEKIYFDPAHPASFEGAKRLYESVKKEGKYNISHSEIKKWLQNRSSYSRNKRVNRNFQRGQVLVSGIDDQFDADLASYIPYASENDNYKYFLAVIDIFSRYAWVEPLKDKSANHIVEAFDKIITNSERLPKRLRTDAATDFTSKVFQNYLKSKDIVHFTTHSEKQANYVERFIKTIKSKIYRYMTENNTARYIDVLPKLLESYNRTWHSGIQLEPINVTKDKEKRLWWQMYWPKERYQPSTRKRERKLEYKFIFNVDDKVRISHLRSSFQREYDTKWSSEIFNIKRRFIRQGQPIYKLTDWFNDPLKGTFYQKELQKVDASDDSLFKVESIIKYRGRGKNKEVKVSWKGWPKKFNSWIPVSNLTDYKK
jgi:hypothetical protein